MGNCFRVRGFVWDRNARSLLQFEGTGTLFEVLVQLFHQLRGSVEPQLVVIENMFDEDVCIENAVLEELSIMAGDPSVDLKEEEKELRMKYDSVYRSEYEPPRVRMEHDGGVLKRIVIEKAG